MTSRRLIGLALGLAVSLGLAPAGAEGQPAGRVWRIGFLGPSASESHLINAFRDGLRELGYTEGKNVTIAYRTTEGKHERAPALAAELVSLGVDVLVASITQNALAAKNATTTIPIVMANVGDPVESGLVASLARPGGNVTGLSRLTAELVVKNLELLTEVVPGAVRIAVLVNRTNPLHAAQLKGLVLAAATRSVRLQIADASTEHGLEAAFLAMVKERAAAVLVPGDGLFFLNRARIAALALKSRLPSMFQNTEHVQAGGLVSYAPSSVDNYRRAAVYVDRILKGAKPDELPVEQPTRFELTINLKTARALGLEIPQSVLLRADQMFE